MSTATGSAGPGRRTGLPWADVVMSAVAAVSWALIGMAGTAALGLRLLDADTAGALGPMAAAVVALAVGGSVTPTGDVSAFGLSGAEADTAVDVMPLGVGLVGALLLSLIFLRSLRTAGVVVSGRELAARAGAVVALAVATAGGLAWAGHDVITVDVAALGVDGLPGSDGGGLDVPGLGDIGELLPDRVGDLVDAQVTVGFTVDTAPTLLAGLGWSAGVLLVALLASRRTPLPRGWEALHRVVRPAVSSVVAVLLVAVAAGIAAAAYAAIGDDHPGGSPGRLCSGRRTGCGWGGRSGCSSPTAPRGPGRCSGRCPTLDDLLRMGTEEQVTLGALAELDGRVWLLGVGAATAMLLAGVLTAVRTPVAGSAPGAGGFAGRCALRLGAATAVTLPVLVWLTEVSVGASLSVLGYDALDAGLDLRGRLGPAVLLGAVWGAGAGAVGALLAWACGVAGTRVAVLARDAEASPASAPPGPYRPGTPYRPPDPDTNPYLRLPGARQERGAPEDAVPGRGTTDAVPGWGGSGDAGVRGRSAPGDAGARGRSAPGSAGGGADDVAAAPTVASPTPPPRPPRPDRRRLWPDRVPPLPATAAGAAAPGPGERDEGGGDGRGPRGR
ncbi:streptophobe family protein [Streptomyces thermocarboxydus]